MDKMECYYDHPDCFGHGSVVRDKKVCVALNDTDFGTRDCPFYKNYLKVRAEWGKERKMYERDETD